MSDTVQITVKVSPKVVERAERLRPYVTSEAGVGATRADVLRRAVALGLRALEKQSSRVDHEDDAADEPGGVT